MKRILSSFAWVVAGMVILTGCFGNNNDPAPTEYEVTTSALIICAGDPVHGQSSCLNYIDFENNRVTDNAFIPSRGSFGDRPNDVMVYGNKVYVAGTDENIVFVFDKKTHEPVQAISTTEEMGPQEGYKPRRFAAYQNKVFVSTSGGYVGVIDTLTLSVKDLYKVGSYPEGMSIGVKDNVPFLYVANSDDEFGKGSISIINLSSGAVSEVKNEKLHAPCELAIAGDEIYVLDRGYYDGTEERQGAGVFLITGSSVRSVIRNAAGMSAVGYDLLTYNIPESPDTDSSYSLYNLRYGSLYSFHLSGDSSVPIVNPTAICIDYASGYVMIGSQAENSETGYVNLYNGSGTFVASYKTGYCPQRIAFIHDIVEM